MEGYCALLSVERARVTWTAAAYLLDGSCIQRRQEIAKEGRSRNIDRERQKLMSLADFCFSLRGYGFCGC